MTQRLNFDFEAFYKALSATVATRDMSWKTVSEETGVSQSTLSRMSKARQPDAASLTAVIRVVGPQPGGFHGRAEEQSRAGCNGVEAAPCRSEPR